MQAVRHDESGELIETNHTKNKELRSKGSDDLQFWFDIIKLEPGDDPSKNIYIIDESSMISSMPSNSETLHFGTDILINDLLTYAQLNLGGKIIFVGDPAQLPPVGDNKSVALDESYFKNKSFGVASFELTEVLRQSGDSSILKNAMMIRDLLKSDCRNKLAFERKQGEVEDILSEQVIESFYENSPNPQIGESIILCYTNSLAKEYNVSRSLISIIVNPERAEAVKQRFKEHWRDYQTFGVEHNAVIRKTRIYKQELYVKGDLKGE